MLSRDVLDFAGSVNSASYRYEVAAEFSGQSTGARVILEMPGIDRAMSALYESNVLEHQTEMIIGKARFLVVSRKHDPDTNTYIFRLEQVGLTKDSIDEPSEPPAAPPPGVGDVSKFVSDGSDIVMM
jgi:hypothetical protein